MLIYEQNVFIGRGSKYVSSEFVYLFHVFAFHLGIEPGLKTDSHDYCVFF